MTEITTTVYRCDYCGTDYDKENDARKCERSHDMPTGIGKVHFDPSSKDNDGYPMSVEIMFGKNKTWWYRRSL